MNISAEAESGLLRRLALTQPETTSLEIRIKGISIVISSRTSIAIRLPPALRCKGHRKIFTGTEFHGQTLFGYRVRQS